jgi:cytochrome c biogenesis protein
VSFLDALIELLSSMRFAISLLTILGIAAIIGTVIQQNEPASAYLNQFGQFWDPVFARLGLYSVYNSGWFIGILAFLVLSTTLCITRQYTPMMREIRGFHEHARETSLRLFACNASLKPTLPPAAQRGAVMDYLVRAGFRVRVDEREDGTLIAAKQGSLGRVGYFLAHSAIILICLGGLLDSNLPLAVQMRLGNKVPESRQDLSLSEFPETAWLAPGTWSYRASIYIPEGDKKKNADGQKTDEREINERNFVVLNVDGGILLQPLPFRIGLKHFKIEHYPNGMPSRYASEVVITDLENGKQFERTIEVNKPLEYRGVTLFQSGFDDGGSKLNFKAYPFDSTAHILLPPLEEFRVGTNRNAEIIRSDETRKLRTEPLLTIELTGFRPINVEDFGAMTENENRLGAFFGSGENTRAKNIRHLGPSYTFKLRDPTGQAREYMNYMVPIELAGRKYLHSGVRSNPGEPFRFLRIPVDNIDNKDDRIDTWFAIHRAFFDPGQRAALTERFALRNLDAADAPAEKKAKNKKQSKKERDQAAQDRQAREAEHTRLKTAAESTLALFSKGGINAISDFIETSVPEAEREKAGEVFLQVLTELIWDAWMNAREAAGQKTLGPESRNDPFIRDTLIALADSPGYAPFYLQLTDYEQKQATVLQATRSPGKPLVYLGSLLLVLGTFAMLYIRERRLFVLLKNNEALMAISSNRKTIDLDEVFARHRNALDAALTARA